MTAEPLYHIGVASSMRASAHMTKCTRAGLFPASMYLMGTDHLASSAVSSFQGDVVVSIVLGTRPELVKLSPLIKRIRENVRIVHTGQHFDRVLFDVMDERFELPVPFAELGIGGQSRASQIGLATVKLEDVLKGSDAVIVQGDTNSALAGALAANALELPLFHVEAGLRSRDRRMPEEHNRILVDHLADVCWAPTAVNQENLLSENIPPERIELTGNPIVEAVHAMIPDAEQRWQTLEGMGLRKNGYILLTLHRPENVDDAVRLSGLLASLGRLAGPVVFPVHPRTAARIDGDSLGNSLANFRMIEPLPYTEFLALMAESSVVVSDSGGVQEEVSILKVPVVVVRRSTERPEVLGTFATLEHEPDRVVETVNGILDGGKELRRALQNLPTPYGDGKATDRIVDSLRKRLSVAGRSTA